MRCSLVMVFMALGCATGDVEPRVDAGVTARDVAAPRDVPTATTDNPAAPTDEGAPEADVAPTGERDGVITRAEINFVVGASVLYAVNDEGTTVEPVDTEGTIVDGTRRWDYTAARAGDRRILDEVMSPAGRWWSSRYPDATYAALIDRTNNILGVYRASATALELLGTVSVASNATDLRMSPAVVVLRFPLRVGETWTQSVTATGFYNFTALTNVTSYNTRVDAQGEVWTSAGRFPALRVRTDIDQAIPLTIIRRTRRTYTFLSERWGVVARVAGVDNESAAAFGRASEYRRLSL